MKGYRTETAYGEGYRNSEEVITHEIKELHNDERGEIAENRGMRKNSKLADIFVESKNDSDLTRKFCGWLLATVLNGI